MNGYQVLKVRCRLNLWYCLSLCLLFMPMLLNAAGADAEGPGAERTAVPPKPSATGVEGGQILEIFLALAVILVMIVGIAWFAKRFSGMGPQGGQHIKTVAVMPVGTRERIAVIQIGERQIVVGITPSQITTLAELDQPLDISQGNGEFARKLQTLLHRGENEAKGEANGTQ